MDYEMNGVRINVRHAEKHPCFVRPKLFEPSGIMLHTTATPGVMAERFCVKWNGKMSKKSVHAFVDNTGIYQMLPWKNKAWHAGRGGANGTHLSFEICEPKGLLYNTSGSKILKYNPPDGYFDAVWKNSVDLCVALCLEFHLVAKNIIGHYEGAIAGIASGHIDPKHWWIHENKKMDDFRTDVEAAIAACGVEPC